MLIIAERTLSGLAHPHRIEEMSKELTKVIEDFDRAMDVETLRLAKESSKHWPQSGDSVFSIVSYRISPARPLAQGSAQACQHWLQQDVLLYGRHPPISPQSNRGMGSQ